MKHLTRPTRSFIFLIIIVLVAAYGALILARHQKNNIPDYGTNSKALSASADQEPVSQDEMVSTKGWQSYDDESYPIKFQYPAKWDVDTDTSMENYYAVELTPSGDKGVIKVYISKQDYFALKGLKTEAFSVNGATGRMVDNWIYAVKSGEFYYTFDSTQASKPLPELRTIISTAEFN